MLKLVKVLFIMELLIQVAVFTEPAISDTQTIIM